MTDTVDPATRRAILAAAIGLSGLPLLTVPRPAIAAGALPKAAAKYQEHPQGTKRCDLCTYYIPAAKSGAAGSCKLVAGPISPMGWCTLFAVKPR